MVFFSKTPIIRLHDLKHLLDIRPGRRFRVRPAKSTRRGRPPLRGRGLSRQARREEKKSCCVPGCGTSDAAEQDKNCFSFPPKPFYPEQNQMWCQAVGLSMNSPYHTLRVCEDHFYLGRPSAVRGHPDYVPSIQMPGENKVQRPVSTQDWAAFHRRLKVESLPNIQSSSMRTKMDNKKCHLFKCPPATKWGHYETTLLVITVGKNPFHTYVQNHWIKFITSYIVYIGLGRKLEFPNGCLKLVTTYHLKTL